MAGGEGPQTFSLVLPAACPNLHSAIGLIP